MKPLLLFSLTFALLGACSPAKAQSGSVLYADNCASCHGDGIAEGSAPSLFDDEWVYGDTREAVGKNILQGIEAAGMPLFDGAFTDEELNGLIDYISNGTPASSIVESQPVEAVPEIMSSSVLIQAVDQVVDATDQIIAQDYVTGLDEPWGFVFLGDDILATEKSGRLVLIKDQSDKIDIKNIPEVNDRGQGGLLDIALDPEFDENGWIYLTYSHALKGKSGPSMTRLVRGRIQDSNWINEEILFEAKPDHYVNGGRHYGSRITFDDDGYLYFSIGDRGDKAAAQNIELPNGKIHRLNKDGTIPADNPKLSKAYPSIFSYGNRNPQGLIWHSDSQSLWETEHGPRGGDELNQIRSGQNYGWPEISYGINYNGTELTPFKAKPGMQQPASQWTPSIAACGLDVYTGDLFPEWKEQLLAGSLAYQSLRLIDVSGGQYVGEVELLKDKGRIRDVATGPDGAIYVALPKKIVRLSPARD